MQDSFGVKFLDSQLCRKIEHAKFVPQCIRYTCYRHGKGSSTFVFENYESLIVDSVFGCELQRLCERENTNVPRFLVKFMEHIERNGVDVVGIYRLSGNAASVTKLRYLVDQGKVATSISNFNNPYW